MTLKIDGRKRKILILANSATGLYKFRNELLERLICEGYEVYASVPYDSYVEKIKNIGCTYIETEIDRRGINPVTDFWLILNYFKMVNKVKPSIVMTYTIKPNVYGGIISRLKCIPYAINITGLGTAFQRETLLKQVIIKMYKFASKKAKVIFFENIENRDIFVRERIVKEDKTCLLNGAGVNLEVFEYLDYPPNGKIKFLFMGRIMAEKGIDELFLSTKRLYAKYPNMELHLLGSFEENYEDVIRESEKDGWLYYHGVKRDVKPFIEACHCYVLPSWHEGMANSNLESAACGRAVITSDIHGCKEAVIDEVSGYLVKRKNADDLYAKMEKFINLPYEKKKEMGLAGRDRMKKVFDRNRVVQSMIETLQCQVK